MLLRLSYNILTFFLGLIANLIFLFFKRGRRNFFERLGFWNLNYHEPIDVWFHAASAGEVAGVLPIIAELRGKHPQLKFLLTCTSPTGLDRAGDKFDFKFLLPFDCFIYYYLALNKLIVKRLYITETEIWPELIYFLKNKDINVSIINARVSSDFVRKIGFLKFILNKSFDYIQHYYCQDELSAKRFKNFGIDSSKISVVGNSKFDILNNFQSFEKKKGRKFPLLVLGSLRNGEEKIWLPLIKKFKDQFYFVLAPRHLEFVQGLENSLRANNIPYKLWSKTKLDQVPVEEIEILLIDTIGELVDFYAQADLAFVGGTLVSGIGGHNPLEPLVFSVPVMLGPHNENQEELVSSLVNISACRVVSNNSDIIALLEKFLLDRTPFLEEASRGRQFALQQLGAAAQLVKIIESQI